MIWSWSLLITSRTGFNCINFKDEGMEVKMWSLEADGCCTTKIFVSVLFLKVGEGFPKERYGRLLIPQGGFFMQPTV